MWEGMMLLSWSVLLTGIVPLLSRVTTEIWLDQYIAREGLLVEPALLLIEVAASVSRQTGQAMRAKEAINTLRSISKIHIVPLDSVLVQVAVDAAIDLQLRAGDSIYVALAHRLNIPLVSWDKEQLQRARSLIATFTPDSYVF